MLYKKIKQSLIALAIATSITSIAQDTAGSNLTANTVKTENGEIVSYKDAAGHLIKKVTVTIKGNVTFTETVIYDVVGKILSKMTVAELKTDEEDPKLIRREVDITNADGSSSREITDITTDSNGVSTAHTTTTTTDPAGNSTTNTTSTNQGDNDQGDNDQGDNDQGDDDQGSHEGDDAGSVVSDNYNNTPSK